MLILVPSQLEYDLVEPLLNADIADVEICGVGVVGSAVKTSLLLKKRMPKQVILMGIAGAYGDSSMIGEAVEFHRVAIWGIGAGDETRPLTLEQFGLDHLGMNSKDDSIGDEINFGSSDGSNNLLLTVCSAAGSDVQVESRSKRYPAAIAEDMEGFSVALACQMTQTPLRIVRGISNVAGNRDKSEWNVELAIRNCVDAVNSIIVDGQNE